MKSNLGTDPYVIHQLPDRCLILAIVPTTASDRYGALGVSQLLSPTGKGLEVEVNLREDTQHSSHRLGPLPSAIFTS
jgi:hypothetical protein